MLNEYADLCRFDGKTVVVTGGVGLLGAQIARCCASFGARTVIADVNEKPAAALLNDLRSGRGAAEFFRLDLSEVAALPGAIANLDGELGPIDVWINAAYPRTDDWMRGLDDMSVASWQRNVDMHLNGYCISSNEIAKRMAKRGGGSIVNIGSIHCHVAPDFRIYEGTEITSPAAYTAIKGGILMYSKYLASYFGRQNVRVNVVSPGGISNRQAPEFVKRYNDKTCLGRMADSREIAMAVAFIASDAASYITGTDLIADGGLTAI